MPINFFTINKDGAVTNRAVASWKKGEGGFTASFIVRHRIGKGSFSEKIETTATTLEIDGLKPGKTLEVQVKAVGIAFGDANPKTSNFAKAKAVVPDLPTEDPKPVPNVRDLEISPNRRGTRAELSWNPPIGVDLNNFKVIIRHSRKTDGTGTFAKSVKEKTVNATDTSTTVSLDNGEYLVKLQDRTTKEFSADAVSVIVNIPDATPKRTILNIREDQNNPPFSSGSRTRGVYYDDSYQGLVLDGDARWDRFVSGDVDDLTEIDFIGERKTKGVYFFSTILDLGGTFEVDLKGIVGNSGVYHSNSIDQRTRKINKWADFDGDKANDTSAALYFRDTTQARFQNRFGKEDGTNKILLEDGSKIKEELSTNFNAWRPLKNNTVTGRTFQFKAELETDDPAQTPVVDELGVKVFIPARTETSSVLDSTAAVRSVTFETPFYEAPAVGITAFNLSSGDYYEVTSVTRTGFNIHFKDSSNSSVDRKFQYVAAGFGSEQT